MHPSSRVVIVEPRISGHHGVWLRWMATGLLSKGWSVEICSLSRNAREPIFQLVKDEVPGAVMHLLNEDLPVEHGNGSLDIYRRDFAYWRLMRMMFKQARMASAPSHVMVPYMDCCLNTVGAIGSPFGNTPWVGISMRPRFHHRDMGVKGPAQNLLSLRRYSFKQMLKRRTLLSCLALDESLVDYVRMTYPRLGAKIRHLPDPIDDVPRVSPQLARQQLGIPSDAIVVLVFGSMNRKKGAQFLLPALAKFPGVAHVHALLMGRHDEYLHSLLQSPEACALLREKRLHVLDKWIDQKEESLAFSAADMVWLGYEAHWQSSGVQIQAGRARLPVVASDEGIIGWFTQKNACGVTVQPANTAAVAAAIQRLSESKALREQLGECARKAVQGHTIAVAVERIDSALRGCDQP